jgi:type II secretory pathway component GspD/PulD (secretin)
MGRATFTLAIMVLFVFVTCHLSSAQDRAVKGDPVVIQIINLDYADAEELAPLLAPLLTPHGRIVAYKRTNSLIIRDKASVVKRLVEVIKGPVDK